MIGILKTANKMIYIEDMTMQLIYAMIALYIIGSIHGIMIGKYIECRRWRKAYGDVLNEDIDKDDLSWNYDPAATEEA